MKIRCRLFGRYAEVTGTDVLELELPEGATVQEALARLREAVANGHQIPDNGLVAVNMEHSAPTRILEDADEIALLPPLAGG
ncbi:MAG: MoaD/ThiS family protein [Gemmatimonadetes bacterium]|nr:MoaD/ThiS family protein [Gemmatimonadota bacterium]MCZ6760001.1 MoaD/ThiS family protein [Gemmatimonadota bacterium]